MSKPPIHYVAIIGTTGRSKGEEPQFVNPCVYEGMVSSALDVIYHKWKLDPTDVVLVSGGSALSDHVAVTLYLRYYFAFGGLQLYLPARFNARAQMYSAASYCGSRLNYLHTTFSQKLGLGSSSLRDIASAIALGAKTEYLRDNLGVQGFFLRNDKIVYASTHLIAFSWTKGAAPSSSGTRYTWYKFGEKGPKEHIRILSEVVEKKKN